MDRESLAARRPTGGLTLVLRPGFNYHVTWFGFLVLSGMAIAGFILWFATGATARQLWLPVTFLAIGLGFIPGILYHRVPRSVEADHDGVRLKRGGRTQRALTWEEVAEVRHGRRLLTYWVLASREGYVLQVRGRRGVRGIAVDDVSYRVVDLDLGAFGEGLGRMAAQRSVAVRRMVPGEAHRGPLRLRLFGEHFNAVAAGASLFATLMVLLFLWLFFQGRLWAIAGLLLSSPLAIYFAYVAWVSKRFYCSRCEAYRYFVPLEGRWWCSWCKTFLDDGAGAS